MAFPATPTQKCRGGTEGAFGQNSNYLKERGEAAFGVQRLAFALLPRSLLLGKMARRTI